MLILEEPYKKITVTNSMKKTLSVEAIRHYDVRGKELLYIRIEDLVINVGEKTFLEVQKLTGDLTEPTIKVISEPATKTQIGEGLTKGGKQ